MPYHVPPAKLDELGQVIVDGKAAQSKVSAALTACESAINAGDTQKAKAELNKAKAGNADDGVAWGKAQTWHDNVVGSGNVEEPVDTGPIYAPPNGVEVFPSAGRDATHMTLPNIQSDKNGVTHWFVPRPGVLYAAKHSFEATQVAAACPGGQVLLGQGTDADAPATSYDDHGMQEGSYPAEQYIVVGVPADRKGNMVVSYSVTKYV